MIKSVLRTIGALLVVLLSVSANADRQPLLDSKTRFHPVISQTGMVVSQEMIASQVGADILAKGGNAVDAAVATGFALAVTLPRAGNIGGGGFMMIYLAEENKTIAIDYREMAPSEAFKDMFLNSEGDVDNRKARFSIQSSGVPGTVAGLVHAQENYGKLSLKQVLKPAINLARNGITVTISLAESLAARSERLQTDAGTKKYFFKKDGAEYQPGDVIRQRDLAATLARISANGAAGFYQGKTAAMIVDQMERTGGLITSADLEGYG